MNKINVLDIGIKQGNNSDEIKENNTKILKENIDKYYRGDVCFYFPIGDYHFNLIEINDNKKVYNIVLEGETINELRTNNSMNEDKKVRIFTNGEDGFINRINKDGNNEIRFYICHICFMQGILYSFKPKGICIGTLNNLGFEYNFNIDDCIFHGYEYCIYSPGYSCGGTKITRTSFSHSKYGLYIKSTSHRLYVDDVELNYCKYGIRLGYGGNPCTIKNIHVAVGCFEGMNEYLEENKLMYAIHTKGGVVIDGIYYEQYVGKLDVSNYYLIHHEAQGRTVGKLIVRNSPIGNMGAGNKGKFYYCRKYIGNGYECNKNPLKINNLMTEVEFPAGVSDFQNCINNTTQRISNLILKTFDLNDNGSLYSVGITIDGKEINDNNVLLSKHYIRKINSNLNNMISLHKKPDENTLLLQYDTVYFMYDNNAFFVNGINYDKNPTSDNCENKYGVHYKGKITIDNITNENTNIIFGIIGKNNQGNKEMIREFVNINKEHINKKIIIKVDEYIPKEEATNVFFGYKCVNNISECLNMSDSKKVKFEIECIYDSQDDNYCYPMTNSEFIIK